MKRRVHIPWFFRVYYVFLYLWNWFFEQFGSLIFISKTSISSFYLFVQVLDRAQTFGNGPNTFLGQLAGNTPPLPRGGCSEQKKVPKLDVVVTCKLSEEKPVSEIFKFEVKMPLKFVKIDEDWSACVNPYVFVVYVWMNKWISVALLCLLYFHCNVFLWCFLFLVFTIVLD